LDESLSVLGDRERRIFEARWLTDNPSIPRPGGEPVLRNQSQRRSLSKSVGSRRFCCFRHLVIAEGEQRQAMNPRL
jgi:hypothetical protein